MTAKHNRVGIIAETPLLQHRLQAVIVDAGYDIAVNTSPERLNRALLMNETISLWVVELEDEVRWDCFIQELFESTDTPILFGDGHLPSKNDESYISWRRRVHDKLSALAPAQKQPAVAPTIDLDLLIQRSVSPRFELPDTLKNAPAPELGPIWVLCASLGGPQAVKEFIDLLPADIPASFIYAQHIDAGCLDALVSSIGRHTALEMVIADHGLQLKNGRVCVVPVDNEIVFTDNAGILWQENPWSGPYGPSHDHLLKNTSAHFGSGCHSIIFSGMGSDGTIGSTLVREQGGTVWAQSTESCVQPSMPDSATLAGAVSFRGNPSQMAERLISWLAEHKTQAA